MKKLLVTMSKAEMKEVYQKQKQKEPDPLTAQFSDRLSREDAIKRKIERRKKTVKLVPSGTVYFISMAPEKKYNPLLLFTFMSEK